MKISFDTKHHWIPGTYVYVDRKGNKIIRYYDGEEFVFNHTARKAPTRHLLIYKWTKKIINKLLTFIDSKFFYGTTNKTN